jgi:predicted phage terminase large subunit-like protein
VHGVVGVDEDGDIYLLDWWRRQADSSEWVESVIDLMEKWRYVTLWAEEKGQIEKGVGPFLTKRMRERRVYGRREAFTSASDKATRARAIQGRMSMGKVYFPKGAPWVDDLVSEILRFPAGSHDDQVDVLSLFGRMLDSMHGASKPKLEPRAAGWTGEQILKMLYDQDKTTSRYGRW